MKRILVYLQEHPVSVSEYFLKVVSILVIHNCASLYFTFGFPPSPEGESSVATFKCSKIVPDALFFIRSNLKVEMSKNYNCIPNHRLPYFTCYVTDCISDSCALFVYILFSVVCILKLCLCLCSIHEKFKGFTQQYKNVHVSVNDC